MMPRLCRNHARRAPARFLRAALRCVEDAVATRSQDHQGVPNDEAHAPPKPRIEVNRLQNPSKPEHRKEPKDDVQEDHRQSTARFYEPAGASTKPAKVRGNSEGILKQIQNPPEPKPFFP